jgi:glycine dehydrogenase
MTIDLKHPDHFPTRHIGPDEKSIREMLEVVGASSVDQLIDQTVPKSIRTQSLLAIEEELSEAEALARLREIAGRNQIFKSFIGCGYSDTITPPVIQRNIFENPGWYTAYTPYQPEVAQGRLEALLNFQQMVIDLTGLEIANASLLDEATAAAEAMTMLLRVHTKDAPKTFFVSDSCHPQTIEVVRTRAHPLGIEVITGDQKTFDFKTKVFGALVQYPATDGAITDLRPFMQRAHAENALVVVATDLLSLALIAPPGEIGADCAVGSAQRFGVPMGYGGPHAAFLATRTEYVRSLPGRLIGVSKDADGHFALRMALQTREQHIRREKATSNICTAQVLLAVMAGMYAVYHGPEGIRAIARRVHALTTLLSRGLEMIGFKLRHQSFFDTIAVDTTKDRAKEIHAQAAKSRVNLRAIDDATISIALDEATSASDVELIWSIFAAASNARAPAITDITKDVNAKTVIPQPLQRTSKYLEHPVFNTHHSETEMLRYVRLLESRDLSLCHSMIALGSCTMKLNAAAEMYPVTFEGFSRLHPFAPAEQAAGYRRIFEDLESQLATITGFKAVSLMPNAGSQGEYAGLLVIDRYHKAKGDHHRNVCLIPQSAHGTNPASAVMAGMHVVVVACDDDGNIDLDDLSAKAEQHKNDLAALMVTYPSTHGVFEQEIRRICSVVHECGGQVYMDGANMNAQVGLCRPGEFGADVCHLNLHKTFCIPHGGGGPGMGPICVAAHLAPFLPTHPLMKTGGAEGIGPVSAAPFGSASILLISWAYIRMMGGRGLTDATKIAILNANYVADRLNPHYPVLYRGKEGRIAHECILDVRHLKKSANIEVEDVAKRLMDYGFHAPTISFPVAGTLMVEPTESESKEELDRFCDALIAIRQEIREIEDGKQPKDDNLLKNAPHTARRIASSEWKHPYSRERAAYPAPWSTHAKFWPPVARLNNVLGDRQLMCSCPPIDAY